MGLHRRAVLLALGGALLAAVPGAAQHRPDPRAPVQTLEAALAGQSSSPSDPALRSAIERSFDTTAVARAVLGDHVRGATTAQFGRFRDALAGRLARELMARRRPSRSGRLAILNARPIRTDEWIVESQLRVPGEAPRALSWRVRAGPRGPLIHDVLGSGTSMVRVLRNEYGQALRRFGLAGLTARMEARNRRGRD